MSSNTPPASSSRSPSVPSPDATQQESLPGVSQADRDVLEYLRARGYTTAEKALLEAIDSTNIAEDKAKAETVVAEDFLKALATLVRGAAKPEEGSSTAAIPGLGNLTNAQAIQNLIASLGSVGPEEILSLDPTDKEEGFRELEAWVEGSLDMYRVSHFDLRLIPGSCYVLSSPNSDPYYFQYFATFT